MADLPAGGGVAVGERRLVLPNMPALQKDPAVLDHTQQSSVSVANNPATAQMLVLCVMVLCTKGRLKWRS